MFRGVARIFGLGGADGTMYCRICVDKFSGVFMGLLKKICPLCAGGEALAPPYPPLATPLMLC